MGDMKNDSEKIVASNDVVADGHVFTAKKIVRRKGVGYGVLKLWQVVLVLLILVCIAGVPASFVCVPTEYEATGRIHVAQYVAPVFSDPQNDAMMPGYQGFRDTQAEYVLSESVLQGVVGELGDDKSISLFDKKKMGGSLLMAAWTGGEFLGSAGRGLEPIDAVYAAIDGRRLVAESKLDSEFIEVSMRSLSKEEARKIVGALLRGYEEKILPLHKVGFDKKIKRLQAEYSRLSQVVANQQGVKGGDVISLANQYDLVLGRMEHMQKQLGVAMAEQLALKNRVASLKEGGGAALGPKGLSKVGRLKELRDYINSDARYVKLIDGVIRAEYAVNDSQQNFSADSNVVRKKTKLLNAVKKSLVDRKGQLEKEYGLWAGQRDAAAQLDWKAKLKNDRDIANAELLNASAAVKLLEESLMDERQQAVEISKEHALAQKRQQELMGNVELRDAVGRRVMQLELERNRQPRITVEKDIAGCAVPYRAPVGHVGRLLLVVLVAGVWLLGQGSVIKRRYG